MIGEKELKDLKLKIKTWESEFTKANSRKPTKEDIQQSPSDIKEAYKTYWKYKNKTDTEKANRDDVWSEKLNKSSKKNVELISSDETLKKFCEKIRQKVSAPGENTDVKRPLHLKKLKCSSTQAEQQENDEFCIKNTHNELINDKDSELDNLEPDISIMKRTKKIVKYSDVHINKKIKTVNVLSASFGFKNIENRLSFDSSLNNDWLERCCDDAPSESVDSTEDSLLKRISPKRTSIFYTSENKSSEIYCSDEVVSLSSHNSIEKECHGVTNRTFNINCVNDISETLHSQSPEHEVSFKPTQYSPCEKEGRIKQISCSELEDKPCSTKLQSSNENAADILEDKKGKKRKLTSVPSAGHKRTSHLERKMASGTLNENFVRVNIKKKKFSRGHRSVNIRKLKWQKWKQLKASGGSGINVSTSACFKCGQIGHWARNCKVLTKNEQFSDSVAEDFGDAPLPTLEEAAELANKSKVNLFQPKTIKVYKSSLSSSSKSEENSISQQAYEDTAMERDSINDAKPVDGVVRPLYETSIDGKPIEAPKEIFSALKELGYTSFRNGQETAIMRILSGLSTLVVLPTGSGKSLCYQLPAYMYAKKYKCIAIVISPLVSLMEDQVTGLPSCLHAVCLHSGMTDVQKKASLQDITERKAQILLVSPEAVIGGLGYGSGILSFDLPPISFACIDEAHCLSQWSHNFRPSYLQLYKVLTQRLKVKCILGLTATANQSTAKEITLHLGLKSVEECVVGTTGIPANLHISVSRDKDRDRALIQLLSGDRFSSCSSIIIYCIRRIETERLATLIRTCLQDLTSDEPPAKKSKSKSKKRNFLWTAEAYHAGLAPPRRRSIQKQFMNGKLRVIVATVAFGMGLDKRDVRAVIHYNMPKSFESYVQEIGRAGRDGLDSHCHLFLDNEGKDIQELQRHIYSNSTDRYIIRKLLRKVFQPCKCSESVSTESEEMQSNSPVQAKCLRHEIAFSISDTIQELDLKEENISTFLCYLELHSKQWIEVLPPTYATCTIRCYGGPKQLRALALKNPPIAAAFALDVKRGRNVGNISTYEFQVVEVASFMGWNTASVKRELKQLEWNEQKRKTGVIVEFSNLAFHLNAPGNLSDDELDDILDFLHEKVITTEKKEMLNLKSLCSIFTKYSHPHYWSCCDEAPAECSEGIKDAINKYFDETGNLDSTQQSEAEISLGSVDVDISDVRNQIRDIIYTNNDQNFTGRAIARIFHGIESPCYPSEVWGKVRKFWRCLLHINFNLLIKLANEELKNAK